jgi:hypothetical protein
MSKRKLTQADAVEIRARVSGGASKDALADAFGVSRRHIDRVVSGETLAGVGGPHELTNGKSASSTLEEFLDGLTLDNHAETLAAAARVIAAKLDACRASNAATAAAAVPALSREFTAVLDQLRTATRGPSPLDLIRQRRDAKVAQQNGHGGDPGRREW